MFFLLLLALLIGLCAFFSLAEISMMAVNRYRLMHQARTGHIGARRVLALLKRPDRLLGMILIGNTLASNLAASMATLLAIHWVGGTSAPVIATILLTLFMLIIGEVMPKTWAALKPERTALACAAVLRPMLTCCLPLVALVNGISNILLRLFGLKQVNADVTPISPEELRAIVHDAGRLMPARNHSMLLSIIDLDKSAVEDVMVPRHKIDGIDLDMDEITLLATLRRCQHTRLPVYRHSINNVIGILHTRSVPEILSQPAQLSAAIVAAMRSPYFIPESTPLHTQLLNFRQHDRRQGVVVNEYGDVTGLITLEDILEEIVGDFTTHLQPSCPGIVIEQDGYVRIAGMTPLRDINRHLNWSLPLGGPRTLNGLLLEQLETFPQGPTSLRMGEYEFEITSLQHNAIASVRCRSIARSALRSWWPTHG